MHEYSCLFAKARNSTFKHIRYFGTLRLSRKGLLGVPARFLNYFALELSWQNVHLNEKYSNCASPPEKNSVAKVFLQSPKPFCNQGFHMSPVIKGPLYPTLWMF